MQKSRPDKKKSLVLDLFGVEEVAIASYDKIRLPRTPLIELKEKKLESLASKYFSIPSDKLWYYPDPPSLTTSTVQDKTETPEDLTIQQIRDGMKEKNRQKKKKSQGKLLETKSRGRPKGTKNVRVLPVIAGQKSMLSFLNFNTV